jgi:hypothetical protein
MKIEQVNDEIIKGKKKLMDEIQSKVLVFQNQTVNNILQSKEYEAMVKGANDNNISAFDIVKAAFSFLPFITMPDFGVVQSDISVEKEEIMIRKFTAKFIEGTSDLFDELINNTMSTIFESPTMASCVFNPKINKVPKMKL